MVKYYFYSVVNFVDFVVVEFEGIDDLVVLSCDDFNGDKVKNIGDQVKSIESGGDGQYVQFDLGFYYQCRCVELVYLKNLISLVLGWVENCVKLCYGVGRYFIV